MTAVRTAEVEATWRDLAALVAEQHLVVSYSLVAGRAYVLVGDDLVWADCAGVTLDPSVPGANAIATARLQAVLDDEADRDRRWLASLSPERREVEVAARQRARRLLDAVPDPPQWRIDAYCERNGREEFR